ncbi:unnamed protein product, partial [Discosporangium mesarthrocarpum]
SRPTSDGLEAAVEDVCSKVVGPSGSVDYRRFEDWVCPPRSLRELRDVFAELVDEGKALGITVAELFQQLGPLEASVQGVKSDGVVVVGRQRLKEGMGTLSVHLTESEVDILMQHAGCEHGGNGDMLLTLQGFQGLSGDEVESVHPGPVDPNP